MLDEYTTARIQLIQLDNEFTDNVTGENGGHFATVVIDTWIQHKTWLERYVPSYFIC